eukprot:TRINITY_DN3695_c0_g1_i1.p1 TRINITY_DN3695_c0_g1~~TRINITY_DN3695_c0_g1_i1.p1  ORF type:complete len:228 (-),score=38.64 TRINITY_DN3695_c0_g1_i1:111-794(-)
MGQQKRMKMMSIALLIALTFCQAEPIEKKVKVEFTIDSLIDFMRGMVEAWEVSKEEVEHLLECIKDLADIKEKVEKIGEIIDNLDFHDWVKLAGQIKNLFVCIQEIFRDTEPCIDSASEIMKLLKKIIPSNPVDFLIKLIYHLMNHGKEIIKDIEQFKKAHEKADFHMMGYYVGEIIEHLLFEESQGNGHSFQQSLLITHHNHIYICLLYTSPSPRDLSTSRMPSSA